MQDVFKPARIQGVTLKNKIVALPVFTGYALPDARVGPLMLEHYRNLAKSGASVVTIPNVAIAENGRTSERCLLLDEDKHIQQVKRLIEVIRENNAVACVQLNHAGRYAVTNKPLLPSALDVVEATKSISALKNFMESFPFVKRFGLTAHVAKMTAGWTNQMTEDDIYDTINAFGDAAVRAVKAGADMIELHGASGYLITQFLSARTNRRRPPWGGLADDRMLFPLKVIDHIKTRLPENIPIGFRLLLDEIAVNGISTSESIKFAQKLEQKGVAYLSATIGTYQSIFKPEIAKQLTRPGYLTELTKELKRHVNIPVVISGRVVSPKLAEKILKNKEADFIGLGRPLLADINWIKKAKDGGQIIGCKSCNTCFQSVVLGESVVCERWPEVLRDRIHLETRFTSRHGYRTLVVLSSRADLEVTRQHMLHRIPIHTDIQDRLLFIKTGEDKSFFEAAKKFITWAEKYNKTHLRRDKTERFFIDNVQNPVDLVMEHLEDNFGIVAIVHDETSEWKKNLVLKAPPDIVVSRSGTHPNLNKVLIPCDLSPFTLMQIRAALHAFHGRSDVDFSFVHVTDSTGTAIERWQKIIKNFEMDPSTSLKVIKPGKELNVAETLLGEVRKGDYGSLILGRRGGLARVRRRIFGSVSERLLDQLPERSFALVG
ncbi:hypothetical protein X474_03805 [Dethiosulfatarculus sandiegensis]|uniref:NADH:flavin oxidoreductase/NADH oxidase N-terminal domain-containing protein n=1 Tax=Dethiosulfatarculus sandiegensis TaxID=1429043 RepID=A0A0D2JBC4_9BACT|nr:hypothetical protein X474_03805 [Dethiosulfatarculus sandiegensis]